MGQNLELTRKAQAWAEHLARIGRLEHSNLSAGISYRWRSLGENVGCRVEHQVRAHEPTCGRRGTERTS